MSANEYQVAGQHYRKTKIQHWDYAASNNFDYFQGQITKYVTRWKDKNGLQDLEKAKHFLEKYIEIEKAKSPKQMELPIRELPPVIDRTGQKHPFGFDPKVEFCDHPLAGVLQNLGKDI